MNGRQAYQKFLALPVIGALSNRIERRRDWPLHNLPDHVLKDIGVTRSEALGMATFRGNDRTRRQRG
jgi:uncharacterized protein YjiS (DUF1127 family)